MKKVLVLLALYSMPAFADREFSFLNCEVDRTGDNLHVGIPGRPNPVDVYATLLKSEEAEYSTKVSGHREENGDTVLEGSRLQVTISYAQSLTMPRGKVIGEYSLNKEVAVSVVCKKTEWWDRYVANLPSPCPPESEWKICGGAGGLRCVDSKTDCNKIP